MPAPQIWHEIRIAASPAAIHTALTDPATLAQWWIPDTRGRSEVGESLEFWIGAACQKMQVTALEPNRLVRWKPLTGPLDDWSGTEVEFLILPREAGCALQFRHFGWPSVPESFPYYSLSWAVFLASLKDLLQTGRGNPFPNRWVDG